MADITNVNIWTTPNDWTWDTLREWFKKINTNINNLNNDKVETSDFTDANIKTKYENNANTNAYTDAEKTKLAWIQSWATANSTDAFLLDRTNHTWTQSASTISDFDTAVSSNTDVSDNKANRNLLKVSNNDTTPNFLRTKLTAGTNITITEVNDWGNEFVQIDNTAPTGDGDVTYINTTKIDSTDGTNSNYWVLSWLVNGVNTLFTVSNWEYVSWTLKVSRNGKQLVQWDSEDWTETNPATWTFTFNTAPDNDEITVSYITQETNTWNLLFEKDIQNITGNYTVLSTDRNIFVDATAWNVTITLPAVADMDSLWLRFVKSDNTGNNVTIETPWSELISGTSSYTMSIPYEDIGVITNGANYFLISN